ncbi:MAG: thiol reductant ABC exporter subunit CydD, partial [Oceanicaulis sp.]
MTTPATSPAETLQAETVPRDQTASLLKDWGKAGARAERAAAALGVLQAVLFIGFAWGAAGAVSALVAGTPPWPQLLLALASAGLRALAQAGEARLGFEAS